MKKNSICQWARARKYYQARTSNYIYSRSGSEKNQNTVQKQYKKKSESKISVKVF